MSAPMLARRCDSIEVAAGRRYPSHRAKSGVVAGSPAGVAEVALRLPQMGCRRSKLGGIDGLLGGAHGRLRRHQLLAAAIELLVDGSAREAGVSDKRQQRERDDRDDGAAAAPGSHPPTLNERERAPSARSSCRYDPLGARPVAGHEPEQHQQDHRADQRDDEAEDVAAAGDVEEVRHKPAANDASDDAHDHVNDDAVAVAADKASSQRPGNTTDDDRPKPADSFHTRTSRQISSLVYLYLFPIKVSTPV